MTRPSFTRSGVPIHFFQEDELASHAQLLEFFGDDVTILSFIEKKVISPFDANSFKFCFVGGIVSNRKVAYILPKYLSPSSLTQSNADYYIKIIKKYIDLSSKEKGGKDTRRYLDDISILMQTFDILSAYENRHGIFKERNPASSLHKGTRIDWSRTISSTLAVYSRQISTSSKRDNGGGPRKTISSASVFYPTPFHHSTTSEEGIVSTIFENVLFLLHSILSPLMRSGPQLNPKSPEVLARIFDDVHQKRSYYTRILIQHLPKEFGERRLVISSLISFLRSDPSFLYKTFHSRSFAFGLPNFSSLWESACIRVFNGKRDPACLAKISWTPPDGESYFYNQRIDAKVADESDENVIILDAKYYNIPRVAKTDPEKIYPLTDVVKQFGYAISYHFGTNSPMRNIHSIFVSPKAECPTTGISYLGKLSIVAENSNSQWADINPIKAFGVNPKHLFDFYLSGRKNYDWLGFVKADHEQKLMVAHIKGNVFAYAVCLEVPKRNGPNEFFIIKAEPYPYSDREGFSKWLSFMKTAAQTKGFSHLISLSGQFNTRKREIGVPGHKAYPLPPENNTFFI